MRYKLLAVDMDGTLLNDESVITEKTQSAVLAAIDKGILFVPSTGRPMCGMKSVNVILRHDSPFITFNGAMVVMGKSKKVLFSRSLRPDSAKEIFMLGAERGLPVVMWIGERLFAGSDCKFVRDYQSITGVDMTVTTDIDSLKTQGVTKMIWIAPPEDAIGLQNEMSGYFNGAVNCHTTRPYLLEFVDAGASKARALQEIGNAYRIDKSEMIAVGDGYNDVSMLSYAGLGVAMQNAPDDIKKMCRYVTSSNNEDGVADVIKKYILHDLK